jgi:hypothetical protein
MRDWKSPFAKVCGIVLIVGMILARPLAKFGADADVQNDLFLHHAYSTLGLLLLTAVGAGFSLRWRTLDPFVGLTTLLSLLCCAFRLYVADPALAGVYPPLLAGLVLVVVGLAAPDADPVKSPSDR